MKQSTKKSTASSDILSGKYFHEVKNKKLGGHGRVIGRVSDELYLVQFYELLGDRPSVQRLVALSDMRAWLFYSTSDEMQHSYEHGPAKDLAISISL